MQHLIEFTAGPNAGRHFQLSGESVRFGRAETCAFRIEGDPMVSSNHAELRAENGGWVIADLNHWLHNEQQELQDLS